MTVQVRGAARRDQELVGAHGLAVTDLEPPPVPVVRCSADRHAHMKLDAFRLERRDECGGRRFVFVRQDPRSHLQHRDARAEPRVELGELDPDRAGADDRERRRRGGRRPDRLAVRPERRTFQARDRRRLRHRPRCQDDPVGDDPRPVGHLDLIRADQARVILQDGYPEILEWPRLLARRGFDHRTDPVHHGAEVDLNGGDVHAEAFGVSRERGDLRAPEHDLRGNAAVVVALPAEPIALGHTDAEAALVAESECDLGSGPAAPDHEHVEALHPTSIARSRASVVQAGRVVGMLCANRKASSGSNRRFTSISRARLSP